MGVVILFIIALGFFSAIESVSSISQTQSDITCETCPMKVKTDAQEHLEVYDGNGTRHYVECIGCAFKLLKTHDAVKITTYCDWYGPNYIIIANISQQGAVATVNPATALTLSGGGCTGNRVAYNQTAATALLANGFSEYTMTMMQQPLPANTNTTTITERAKTFVQSQDQTSPPLPLVQILLVVLGFGVVVGSFVAYRKFH